MTTSQDIKELAAALAAAQKEVKNAVPNADNPFFKSKYADLETLKAACVPALNKHDIAVIQAPVAIDGKVGVITRLMHKSGQWIEGDLLLPCSKQDAQAYGSAVSYARRYTLAAFCGVATTDDDGNAATHDKPAAPPAKRQAPAPAPSKPIHIDPTPDSPEELSHVVMNYGVRFKGKEIKDIPPTALEKAAEALNLTNPDEIYVQACIVKYLKLLKESVS
jgi:hypothetical protein